MTVFEYFYNKMYVFGPRMDKMAVRDQRNVSLPTVISLSTCQCLSLSTHPSICLFLSLSLLSQARAFPHPPDHITRSLILAISVCYHARLQERKDYEEGVAAQFLAPLGLPGGVAQFRNEIQWYHVPHDSLSHMEICCIEIYFTILCSQLPGGATGQHDPGTKHCQECCPPRECVHDGDLY